MGILNKNVTRFEHWTTPTNMTIEEFYVEFVKRFKYLDFTDAFVEKDLDDDYLLIENVKGNIDSVNVEFSILIKKEENDSIKVNCMFVYPSSKFWWFVSIVTIPFGGLGLGIMGVLTVLDMFINPKNGVDYVKNALYAIDKVKIENK